MSINIGDNLSLLASLAPLNRKSDRTPLPQDTGFAGRLERALAGADASVTSGEKARVIAEALSLQMLQTTLSLSGDPPAEASPLPVSSRINSLLNAYTGNPAAAGENPASPAGSPAASAPSQLNDLARNGAGPSPVEHRSKQSEPSWLDPIISRASQRYGIDIGLIKAVIKSESNFNPQAVSHAGAQGLMQLMPATARSLGVSDSFDPEQNVMAGTRFLSDMLRRYNGDVDSALAAYNWGPGNVDRRPDRLPRETRDYLVRVKQLYSSYTG